MGVRDCILAFGAYMVHRREVSCCAFSRRGTAHLKAMRHWWRSVKKAASVVLRLKP